VAAPPSQISFHNPANDEASSASLVTITREFQGPQPRAKCSVHRIRGVPTLHGVELPVFRHRDKFIDSDKFFLRLEKPCEPRLEIEEGSSRRPKSLKHHGHSLDPDLPNPELGVLPYPARSNPRSPPYSRFPSKTRYGAPARISPRGITFARCDFPEPFAPTITFTFSRALPPGANSSLSNVRPR